MKDGLPYLDDNGDAMSFIYYHNAGTFSTDYRHEKLGCTLRADDFPSSFDL